MTLNRYSHLYPDHLDELAVHLDAVRTKGEMSRRLGDTRDGRGSTRGR